VETVSDKIGERKSPKAQAPLIFECVTVGCRLFVLRRIYGICIANYHDVVHPSLRSTWSLNETTAMIIDTGQPDRDIACRAADLSISPPSRRGRRDADGICGRGADPPNHAVAQRSRRLQGMAVAAEDRLSGDRRLDRCLWLRAGGGRGADRPRFSNEHLRKDADAFAAPAPLATVPLRRGALAARVLEEALEPGFTGAMIGALPKGVGGTLDDADLDPFGK
jgi:hypothetical protein